MTAIQNLDLVTLEYRSSQLPSSQHRAGLAGLILKIQWLQEQANFKQSVDTVCKIIDLDADKVTLQFNLNGLTALLRSHYSASFEERESKKLRTKGHKNFRKIEREVANADTDKRELTTFYIYKDLVPQGYLVQSFEPPDNDNRVWTKLWQEATWTILRPRDRQRLPFKAMISGTDPPEIEKIWKLLRDRPRIHEFYSLLRDLPTSKTIKNDLFCRDFQTVFCPKNNAMELEKINETKSDGEIDSGETSKPTQTKEISIESLLLRLLKTYTRHQLERRFKLKWNKDWDKQKPEVLKQNKAYQDYREKRKQIIVDLHHDFCRPREADDFLTYFASKFTDVYQYITTEEYLLLAQLIQTQPGQIRILCLVALPVL